MPLYDVSKMMATYTTDFGSTDENVTIKLTTEAPIPANFYSDRPDQTNCSNASLLYKPRRLVAKFDFGIHEYPVPSIDVLPARITALIGAGAMCVDLVGEKWSNVPGNLLSSASFKTTPYPTGDGSNDAAVDGTNDKQVGDFEYTSDIGALGTFAMRYNIEERPAAIATALIGCMNNATPNPTPFCPTSTLGIKPRYFIVKAAVAGGRSLGRKARVSDRTALGTCGGDLSSVAYCLGYQGESIKNVHNLI